MFLSRPTDLSSRFIEMVRVSLSNLFSTSFSCCFYILQFLVSIIFSLFPVFPYSSTTFPDRQKISGDKPKKCPSLSHTYKHTHGTPPLPRDSQRCQSLPPSSLLSPLTPKGYNPHAVSVRSPGGVARDGRVALQNQRVKGKRCC